MWSRFRMDKYNARLEFVKLFMIVESQGVSTLFEATTPLQICIIS